MAVRTENLYRLPNLENGCMRKNGKLIITAYTGKNTTKQVACFVANNRLEYLKVIPDAHTFPAGTILTGKVTNVVPNIPAAFVALNTEKVMGFLPLSDAMPVTVLNRTYNGRLVSGDEVLVKVLREPMKTKEYTLTTTLDMTTRYAAAHSGHGRLFFSKKLSPKQKERILAYLVKAAFVTRDKALIAMPDADITIRTEAGNLNEDTLKLLKQDITEAYAALQALVRKARARTCYTVHQKPVTWLTEVCKELCACDFKVEEYVTDDFLMLQTLKDFAGADKLRFYQDDRVSLAALYGLTEKIEELLKPKVWLPSGAYLCIEPTEAMVVVDVNTGKAIQKADDSEVLFYEVNMEAAAEIARQLRLRNLSGMVLIDFINMKAEEHTQAVLAHMKACVKNDFAQNIVYDFTKLGLLEMTRSKKSKALYESMRGYR